MSVTMQALLAAQPMTNWLIRGSINSLAPLIAAEYGFTDEQRAMLLAAFFPGCALRCLARAPLPCLLLHADPRPRATDLLLSSSLR